MNIEIELGADGSVAMLHDDAVDLSALGRVEVSRASHVEFDNATQLWTVTSAKTGKLLHSAKTRAEALAWEHSYYSPSGQGWAELQEA